MQQLWLDIFPGKIRCSIHMCNKSDRFFVLHAGSGRQQTIHVTMVSEHNLG